MSAPRVVCVGELVWDLIDGGECLGGSPVNVAYHLAALGCAPSLVSAVGEDARGVRAMSALARWRVDAAAVRRHADLPTGVVDVAVGADGSPVFTIAHPAAWDRLHAGPTALDRARDARAIVFGSLALRDAHNRGVLDALLAATRGVAVFDVNLREPWVDLELVRALAARCAILKVTDAELARLLDAAEVADLVGGAAELARRIGIRRILVTAGALGAGAWWDGAWSWEPARPVTVVDTVGAGDSFVAAFLAALLGGAGVAGALARGARLAEHVVAARGPTPPHPPRAAAAGQRKTSLDR